jgi:hypothetical protein
VPSWFQRYRAKDWVTARTLDLGGVGRKCLKRCVRLADIIGCACDARQAYAGRMVQPNWLMVEVPSALSRVGRAREPLS